MKRIENLQARNLLFAKKRKEITKMAAKLSKLANIDIHFLAFSPSGRPYVSSATCTDSSPSFDQVVDRILKDHAPPPPLPPLPSSSCSTSVIDFQKSEPPEFENLDQEMIDSVLNVDISNMSLSEVQAYKEYLLKLKSKVSDVIEKKRGSEVKIGGSFVQKDEIPMLINSDCVTTDQAVLKGATDEIADGLDRIEHEKQKMMMNTSIASDGESDEEGEDSDEIDDDDDEEGEDGDEIDDDVDEEMLFGTTSENHFDDIDEVLASFDDEI